MQSSTRPPSSLATATAGRGAGDDVLGIVVIVGAAVIAVAVAAGMCLAVMFVRRCVKRRRSAALSDLREQNPQLFATVVSSELPLRAPPVPSRRGSPDTTVTRASWRASQQSQMRYLDTVDPMTLQKIPVWRYSASPGGGVSPAELGGSAVVVAVAGPASRALTTKSSSSTLAAPPGNLATPSTPPRHHSGSPPGTPPSSVLALNTSNSPVPASPSSTVADPPGDTDTCTICLDAFEPDEVLRRLPCGHSFHVTCIDDWLFRKRAVCPVCRMDLSRGGEWYRRSVLMQQDQGGDSSSAHAAGQADGTSMMTAAGPSSSTASSFLGVPRHSIRRGSQPVIHLRVPLARRPLSLNIPRRVGAGLAVVGSRLSDMFAPGQVEETVETVPEVPEVEESAGPADGGESGEGVAVSGGEAVAGEASGEV